jgi:phage protein D
MPDTSSRLRVARPSILVEGQEDPRLTAGLLSLEVVEDTEGLYRCEAAFGNWGKVESSLQFLYFDRRLLDFGKRLEVRLDSEGAFQGRITGIEAKFREASPPEITVLAEDRFQDLRMTRRTRTFEDMSDSEVMNQIAGEYGLTPDIDIDGPNHQVLAQVNQSDLAFLRDRACSMGAELWVEGDRLSAKPRSRRNGSTTRMTYQKELREFRVLADLAHQSTGLFVKGWDIAGKSALDAHATDDSLGAELEGDASGAHVLESAFGQRKQSLVHTAPVNSQEAEAVAAAYYRRLARRFVVGKGIALPSSPLRVGNFVDLEGLGPLFSGKYYLSRVRLVFDGLDGLRTEFTGERPGLGEAA